MASVLRMAAVSLQRSRSALGTAFRPTVRHKGYSVAVFAMARKLAVLIYRTLRCGRQYVDIGEEAYESRFRHQRLASLGAAAESLAHQLVQQTAAAA